MKYPKFFQFDISTLFWVWIGFLKDVFSFPEMSRWCLPKKKPNHHVISWFNFLTSSTAAQWGELLPHNSRILVLIILSLDYCPCSISHVLPVVSGVSTWFPCNRWFGSYILENTTCLSLGVNVCVHSALWWTSIPSRVNFSTLNPLVPRKTPDPSQPWPGKSGYWWMNEMKEWTNFYTVYKLGFSMYQLRR